MIDLMDLFFIIPFKPSVTDCNCNRFSPTLPQKNLISDRPVQIQKSLDYFFINRLRLQSVTPFFYYSGLIINFLQLVTLPLILLSIVSNPSLFSSRPIAGSSLFSLSPLDCERGGKEGKEGFPHTFPFFECS